jgi:hypothetical protein
MNERQYLDALEKLRRNMAGIHNEECLLDILYKLDVLKQNKYFAIVSGLWASMDDIHMSIGALKSGYHDLKR